MSAKKENTLKKAIALRIMLIVAVALLAFIIALIIIIPQFNRQSAKDTARSHLAIFAAYLENSDDFNSLVQMTDGDLRITVIAFDGMVLADTLTASPENLESRLGRPEVQTALAGGIGEDIRRSQTFRVDFLYMAKIADVGDRYVVLRVAIPVRNINAHLIPFIGIMGLIFALVLLALLLVTPQMAKSITIPVSMIKTRLEDIDSLEKPSMVLTRHDEINRILLEIDEISKRLSDALNASRSEKQKLDLILENINQAIIAVDSDKMIISCNKTAEEYFCFEFLKPVLIECAIRNRSLIEKINQAFDKSDYIVYDYMRLDGQIFEVRIFPVSLNGIRLIISAQNVTQIRKTALEKQEFFANASHELNTPLSSVLGYSELLLQQGKCNDDNNQDKLFAETIHREALRMKLLISDMLKISELEESKDIADKKIDLKLIVETVITSVLPKAESKCISIKSDLESCIIFANAEKITEVAANLIDNAIKYNDLNGSIFVSVKNKDNKAVFTVKDSGIGIPKKDLSRVFERFYRVNKARSGIDGGTGLGLSIVKHICSHYSAPIKIQSAERLGTELSIEFRLDSLV